MYDTKKHRQAGGCQGRLTSSYSHTRTDTQAQTHACQGPDLTDLAAGFFSTPLLFRLVLGLRL